MSRASLLIPLRVPELGPAMGKLVTGTGRRPGGITLDGPRLRLVTRVFDAAGEARRLVERGEREAALAALGRQTWLDAWEEAVTTVTGLVVEEINGRLERAATASRLPAARRAAARLDDHETGVVGARLGSAGAELVAGLDQLEAAAGRVKDATAMERDALSEWQDGLGRAGRRLEAAWLALEEQLDRELAHWDGVALELRQWRRGPWPVVAVGVPVLALAVWLGLVFGGYVAPPDWMAALWTRVAG